MNSTAKANVKETRSELRSNISFGNLNGNYKKWLYRLFITSAVLLLLYNNFLRSDKIVYVDSTRILNEYKGSVEAKKQYQQKAKLWQANIDTLTEEVKSSIKGYEHSLATMSDKEKSLAKQLIQTKQKQLLDYQKAIQDNAQQENAKTMNAVVSQINSFLSAYGKKHNYKLILIANQSGTIAYAREGLDITNDIIEELNKENGK